MKKHFLTFGTHLLALVLLISPMLVSAQVNAPTACAQFSGFGTTICDVIDIMNDTLTLLNPVIFALSFVVFFWGLSKFILNSGSKDEIEKGKNYMVWGILALFILISFRAIITFITSDFGFGNSTVTPQIPQA